MHAALIATRNVTPVIIAFYHNQLVAATTTFACLTITRRAAFITTSLPVRYQLSLSLPGSECVLDQMNRMYVRLIGQGGDFDPVFLSNTIAQVIVIVTGLIKILNTLPVASANASPLNRLQTEAMLALRILYSLAVPPNALSFA